MNRRILILCGSDDLAKTFIANLIGEVSGGQTLWVGGLDRRDSRSSLKKASMGNEFKVVLIDDVLPDDLNELIGFITSWGFLEGSDRPQVIITSDFRIADSNMDQSIWRRVHIVELSDCSMGKERHHWDKTNELKRI